MACAITEPGTEQRHAFNDAQRLRFQGAGLPTRTRAFRSLDRKGKSMGVCKRWSSRTAWAGLAAVLGWTVITEPARAQTRYDPVASAALAMAAYEASRQQCVYSKALGQALDAIDAQMARTQGYVWQETRRTAPEQLPALRNTARLLGAASDCIPYGNAVGAVMPAYLAATDLDPAVLAEMNALMRGGGRQRSGQTSAGPRPLACDPTTAPGMMRIYNRKHGLPDIGPQCPD